MFAGYSLKSLDDTSEKVIHFYIYWRNSEVLKCRSSQYFQIRQPPRSELYRGAKCPERICKQTASKDALLQKFFDSQALCKVQRLLHISELPEKDLAEFHRHYVSRSCQTFISGQAFQQWLGYGRDWPQVLWLNGPHAVGKSVLSSCVITLLRERGTNCHFYYFRFEDEESWGAGKLLRPIAYQVAKDVPHFREELVSLSETLDFQEAEERRDIWRTLLIERLSQVISSKRIYWVVDAIEICRSPDVLLDTVAYLVKSNLPLRVLFLSRHTTLLSTAKSG